MIVFRRALAILLIPLLVVAVFGALLVDRLNATIFQSDFYIEQLRDADAYNAFHDDVLPAALNELLQRQDEDFPENLRDLNLPTDPVSQRVMLDVIREAIPPEYLQELTEHVLGEFLPYLLDETDEFELTITLSENVNRIAKPGARGSPSQLEQAYRELDLGRLMIGGLTGAAVGVEAGSGDPGAVLEEQFADPDAVVAWFDDELFISLEQVRPWLVGESEHFQIEIGFARISELAVALARPLRRSEAELLSDGFRLSDADVRAELAEAESAALNDVDRVVAIFRPTGWSYSERDLEEDIQAAVADSDAPGIGGDADGNTLDVDAVRAAARAARGVLRLGSIGLAVVLTLLIALLGARSWRSSAMWGVAAVIIAAGFTFSITGPFGYAPRLSPKIHETLLDSTEHWSGARAELREPLVERADAISSTFAAGIAWRSGIVLGASLVLFGALAVWPRVTRWRVGSAGTVAPGGPAAPS